MPTPTVIDTVAYRFSDQDILVRVAEKLSDGSMAFKVDVLNGVLNPVPVFIVSGAQGQDVHDPFISPVPLAQDGFDTHIYTVGAGKVFNFEEVQASCSGLMRLEIKTGNPGFEQTIFVEFNSPSFPKIKFELDRPKRLTAGQKVVIIRTHRDPDGESRTIYSLIVGNEILA